MPTCAPACTRTPPPRALPRGEVDMVGDLTIVLDDRARVHDHVLADVRRPAPTIAPASTWLPAPIWRSRRPPRARATTAGSSKPSRAAGRTGPGAGRCRRLRRPQACSLARRRRAAAASWSSPPTTGTPSSVEPTAPGPDRCRRPARARPARCGAPRSPTGRGRRRPTITTRIRSAPSPSSDRQPESGRSQKRLRRSALARRRRGQHREDPAGDLAIAVGVLHFGQRRPELRGRGLAAARPGDRALGRGRSGRWPA